MVSSRTGTPASYTRNTLVKDPALFGNFLGSDARRLRTRMYSRPTAKRLPFSSRTGGSSLMAATNLNRVCLTGNLTRDPELRNLPSGMSVCSLRVASNTRRKDQSTGEWVDKANYFSITVWGAQGEN